MKSPLQPLIPFLEQHINNPVVIKQYLSDYLLTETYSPEVLKAAKKQWNNLPFYITEHIDFQIELLIHNPSPDMQQALNRYWIKRAVQVLKGYSNCPIPLSKDKRIIGPRRNLLSENGRQRLKSLEHAAYSGLHDDKTAVFARAAAQKANLDLGLFIDLSYFEPIVRNDGLYRCDDYKEFLASMSTGCYNGCVHCGFDAKAPVSHMPYPIFLKLFNLIYANSPKRQDWVPYSNSDPITYYDPIINADAGDVIFVLSQLKQKTTNTALHFLTKGVLTKKDEITFAKVVHHAKSGKQQDTIPLHVALSLIDLPGEPINKNFERIQSCLQIAKEIDQGAVSVVHRHLPKQAQMDTSALETITSIYHTTSFDIIGRWAETVEKLAKENNPYKPEPMGRLAGNQYVIGADLVLYDVFRDRGNYVWQPLCSILDEGFVTRLRTAIRTHPTVIRPAQSPQPTNPSKTREKE